MTKIPLFEIYNDRKLLSQPGFKHHFMDLESIHWIQKNKPNFDGRPSINLNLKVNIEKFLKVSSKYSPLPEWFFVSEEMDTIHGMRHILRVSFFTQILISSRNQESPQDHPNLSRNSLIASFLHDLRRRNDLPDINHSNRAADWFIRNTSLVENQFELRFSQEDVDEIYYTIYFHNKPYKDERFSRRASFQKHRTTIDILKTADALDRYRLPNVDFWIKDKYLALVPSENLKQLAFELLISSENNFIKGFSNIESVLMGLKHLDK
jgi:hypothetical protein